MNLSTVINGQYYSPAKNINIASGATKEIEFRGLSGDPYLFNRINIGCNDPSKLNLVKAKGVLNKRDTIFKDVQLLAMQRLFTHRSLKGGYKIAKNKTLKITLENTAATALDISIDLNGYDKVQYQHKLQQYEERGAKYPEPYFVYGTADIAAGADQQKVNLDLPTEDSILHRIAMSSGSDNNLRASFRVDNTDIMPERFISQVNDQFKDMDIIYPVKLNSDLPFNCLVSNLDAANGYEVSVLCEVYKVQ